MFYADQLNLGPVWLVDAGTCAGVDAYFETRT
jgi:hypothetical protein